MTDIDLLEDVAPASNELGAIADMAQILSQANHSELHQLSQESSQTYF